MFEPPTITIFDTWYIIEIYHGPYTYRTHINVVLHYCKYIYVYEPPSKSIVDAWYENIYSVTVRWHIEKAEKTPSITKKPARMYTKFLQTIDGTWILNHKKCSDGIPPRLEQIGGTWTFAGRSPGSGFKPS